MVYAWRFFFVGCVAPTPPPPLLLLLLLLFLPPPAHTLGNFFSLSLYCCHSYWYLLTLVFVLFNIIPPACRTSAPCAPLASLPVALAIDHLSATPSPPLPPQRSTHPPLHLFPIPTASPSFNHPLLPPPPTHTHASPPVIPCGTSAGLRSICCFFCTFFYQGLLAAEDYLGALDILQSAKRTVNNELGKLQSLKHVGRWAVIYIMYFVMEFFVIWNFPRVIFSVGFVCPARFVRDLGLFSNPVMHVRPRCRANESRDHACIPLTTISGCSVPAQAWQEGG